MLVATRWSLDHRVADCVVTCFVILFRKHSVKVVHSRSVAYSSASRDQRISSASQFAFHGLLFALFASVSDLQHAMCPRAALQAGVGV